MNHRLEAAPEPEDVILESPALVQHREIVLDVDSSSWGYLEPGDAVTVTDSTVGLRDALAWVTSVPWAPAPVISLRLLVLSNPAITPYEAA